MRRFSQRNSLVTLSDINITPLLDIAFVLLIIFIITTPLLEQGIQLQLPKGGAPEPTQLKKEDIHLVEISAEGAFHLNRQPLPLEQVEVALVREFATNPSLVIAIRADRRVPFGIPAELFRRLELQGLSEISIQYDVE